MYRHKHILHHDSYNTLNIQDITDNNVNNNIYYLTSPYQELKKVNNIKVLDKLFLNGKKIESIAVNPKRTKIKLVGLTFWIFGDLHNIKQNDIVDIEYDFITVDGNTQRWITRIQLLESKKNKIIHVKYN